MDWRGAFTSAAGPTRTVDAAKRQTREIEVDNDAVAGRDAEKWRRSLKGSKILTVLDGSRWADAVLRKAVELARQYPGAKVVVVRVIDPATLPRDGGNETRVAAINEAAEYLAKVAARLRGEGVRTVGRSVWYAASGPAIVELARTVKPDVILMADDRGNRAGRPVKGQSIAEFVRHRTQAPIVLVSATDSSARTSAGDAMAVGKEMIHA